MQTTITTITRPLSEMSTAEVLAMALENGGRIGGMGFTVLSDDAVAALCDAAQHGEHVAAVNRRIFSRTGREGAAWMARLSDGSEVWASGVFADIISREQAARNLAIIGIDIASMETAPAPFALEDEKPFHVTPVKHPYTKLPVFLVEGAEIPGTDPGTEWYFTTRAAGSRATYAWTWIDDEMREFVVEELEGGSEETAFMTEILREPVRAAELISNDIAGRLLEENKVLAILRAARFGQPYEQGDVVWVGPDEDDRFGVRAEGTGYVLVGGDGSEVIRTVSDTETMIAELRGLLSNFRSNIDF